MPPDAPPEADFLLEMIRRSPMLAALRDGPKERRALEADLDVSKSSIYRNITSLEELDLVERVDGGYLLTSFGEAVADTVETFNADMETTVRLAPLYDAVAGIDPPCPVSAFANATVTTADRGDPFEPLARFVTLVRETSTLRMADSYAIAPTYLDEIHGRVLDGLETHVIERPDVAEDIMNHYPQKCVQLCATENMTMRLRADLPIALVVFDDHAGVGMRNPDTGTPHAFIDTDDPTAREWVIDLFEAYWDGAIQLRKFNPMALREAIEAEIE